MRRPARTLGLLIPLALLDCDGSSDNAGVGEGGSSACPATPPTPGTACTLADGTTCNNYPAPGCYCCSAPSYECLKGKWTSLATGGPPSSGPGIPNCPSTVPTQGSPCSSGCGGAQMACTYDCTTGEGWASSATCSIGTWNVTQSAAPCPADGGLDANDASDASDGGDGG